MQIFNLELLNQMSTIINEEKGSSDYAITAYLIENTNNLENITVNSIMDEAHVSRSSIRRYCHRMGYDNLSDLKSSVSDIIFPSNIHLRSFNGVERYKPELMNSLVQMIVELNDAITQNIIEEFCQSLANYDEVYVYTANNTRSNLIKFQQELFYVKKIINLSKVDRELNCFDNQNKQKTLIVVVSISGVYARSMLPLLPKMSGEKILITANQDPHIALQFNQTIYLSKNNVTDDRFGLIGKYGITYFFDLVSENYIAKYRQ